MKKNIFACQECLTHNYRSYVSNGKSLVLNKYCRICKKKTAHKSTF